jgi:hypothetical protein
MKLMAMVPQNEENIRKVYKTIFDVTNDFQRNVTIYLYEGDYYVEFDLIEEKNLNFIKDKLSECNINFFINDKAEELIKKFTFDNQFCKSLKGNKIFQISKDNYVEASNHTSGDDLKINGNNEYAEASKYAECDESVVDSESSEYSNLDIYINPDFDENEFCEYLIDRISRKSNDMLTFAESLANYLNLKDEDKTFFINSMEAAYDLKTHNQPIRWSGIYNLLRAKKKNFLATSRHSCIKAVWKNKNLENIRLATMIKDSVDAVLNNIESYSSNSDFPDDILIPKSIIVKEMKDIKQHDIFLRIISNNCSLMLKSEKFQEILEKAYSKSSKKEMYKYLLDGIGFFYNPTWIRNEVISVMCSVSREAYNDYKNSNEEYLLFDELQNDYARSFIISKLQVCLDAFFKRFGSGEHIEPVEFMEYAVLVWYEKEYYNS